MREGSEPAVPMLPQEIYYLVIDESASDKQELSRLSLVSPDWTVYAQSFLFSRVDLGILGPRTASFLALLQRNPALGRHVRRLQLSITNFDHLLDENWADPAAVMEFLDRSILHDCLLRISSTSIKSVQPVGAAAAAIFAGITTLRLTYLRFQTSGVFLALLRLFPKLWALELQRLEIRSGHTSVIQPPSSPPNTPLGLRSLSVDEDSLSLMLEWLSTYTEHPTLDELLMGSVSRHFTMLNATLAIVGRRLHHLTLQDCSPDLTEAIDMQPCTALQRVSLEGATKGAHVLSFIQQLTSPHLERISLDLDVHVTILGEDSTSTAWAQIEAALAGPHFPRFRRLVLDFGVWGDMGPHAYRAAIQRVRQRWLLSDGANQKRYQLDLKFSCSIHEPEEIRDIISAGNFQMS
ncbi:hypothetical protein C8J57DRAFT_1711982 [Mycena rebaudengoi]|nr:hypothetical protein C8J57DRAFT_1711982 [Mycena rebaudengoi]